MLANLSRFVALPIAATTGVLSAQFAHTYWPSETTREGSGSTAFDIATTQPLHHSPGRPGHSPTLPACPAWRYRAAAVTMASAASASSG